MNGSQGDAPGGEAGVKELAKVLLWSLIVLLYALGGAGLYLRARYMRPSSESVPTSPPTPAVITAVSTVGTPTITLVVTPTPTLYPTITPRALSS